MPVITISSINRNATGLQDVNHMEIIKLIGDRKGKDSKIGKRPPGLQT
jgi:hypothetical protein